MGWATDTCAASSARLGLGLTLTLALALTLALTLTLTLTLTLARCRFFSAAVFSHAALLPYTYVWRLDTDSFLLGEAAADPFAQMEAAGATPCGKQPPRGFGQLGLQL